MKQNSPVSLVTIFSSDREEILHAVRENFRYVKENGGYSWEKLADLFRHSMPIIQWDKGSARRFLEPGEAGEDGSPVTLKSATPLQITEFLNESIRCRDTVTTQLRHAREVIEQSRSDWADFECNPVDRDFLVQTIRAHLLFLNKQGGYSYECLSDVMRQTCPVYEWNRISVTHFVNKTKGHEHIPKASAEMVVETLKRIMAMRQDVMEKFSEANKLIQGMNQDGPV